MSKWRISLLFGLSSAAPTLACRKPDRRWPRHQLWTRAEPRVFSHVGERRNFGLVHAAKVLIQFAPGPGRPRYVWSLYFANVCRSVSANFPLPSTWVTRRPSTVRVVGSTGPPKVRLLITTWPSNLSDRGNGMKRWPGT